MKFKIGNKVRVIKIRPDSSQERKKYLGKVFTISEVNPSIQSDKHYGVSENPFIFFEDELEIYEFTKSNLEDCMVVELNDGTRMMVCGERFIGKSYFVNIKNLDDDLNNKYSADHSVRKIFRSYALCLNDYFDDECLEVIWERHDYELKTEIIKDMTVLEIERELGYKVRIKSE